MKSSESSSEKTNQTNREILGSQVLVTSVPPMEQKTFKPDVPELAEKLPVVGPEVKPPKSFFDNAIFLAKLSPHAFSLLWAIAMKNSSKIAAAVSGLIIAILGHWLDVIPEQLAYFIDTGVALLIGWLVPAPNQKEK